MLEPEVEVEEAVGREGCVELGGRFRGMVDVEDKDAGVQAELRREGTGGTAKPSFVVDEVPATAF